MIVNIPYGTRKIPLKLPEGTPVLEPKAWENTVAEEDIVERALLRPISSLPLRELARGAFRVLLIASDHTRPVPSRLLVPRLLREIRAGNPDAEIVILIATGMHRAMTEEEILAKFGPEIAANVTIECHDCRDEKNLSDFGTLPSGGRLRLNSRVRWADLILSEGFIEPHFFAGFSGGRKSILLGLASGESVMFNHSAPMIEGKSSRQGVLAGNRIHEDMAFAAKAAGLRFILNVILDPDKRIAAAFSGDPDAAHLAGCRASSEQMRVRKQEADIVITSNGGYPLDQNIYQTVKSMTAAESCVRPGGTIIVASECRDGVGGDGFFRFLSSYDTPEALMDAILARAPEDTLPDQWQAQIFARVLMRARVIFVTEEKNRAAVEAMHMTYAKSVEDALRLAGDGSILAIPDGVGVIVE